MAEPDPRPHTGGTPNKPSKKATAQLNDLLGLVPSLSPSLVGLALLVGFVLLALGLWGEIWMKLDGIIAVTFIVSGLALIFGAFGAQATVQWRGVVIAGVAAIALVFLYAVNHLRQESYAIIELLTSKKPTSSLRVGSSVIRGAVTLVGETQSTRFFIRWTEMGSDPLPYFVVAFTVDSEQPVCFPRERIAALFGRSGHTRWTLDEAKLEIVDLTGTEVGSQAGCYGRLIRRAAVSVPVGLVIEAHAQAAGDLNALIQDVLSENTDVRRLTRDRIADVGTTAVRPLMDSARQLNAKEDRLAFRMNVGSAVAINSMLYKKGTTTSGDLQRALEPEDFETIIKWSLDSDASLRIPAAGILASTADLATLEKLTKSTVASKNENVVYNSAWILSESYSRLKHDKQSVTELKTLAGQLRKVSTGPKTAALLEKFEAQK